MKTIKIKYVGFWDGFNPENCPFTKMILDNYNVVESDNPDYIICSCCSRVRGKVDKLVKLKRW